MEPVRPLREVFAELSAGPRAGSDEPADPRRWLADHGHPDLPDGLLAEAIVSYAGSAPVEVAEHLEPFVTAHGPLPSTAGEGWAAAGEGDRGLALLAAAPSGPWEPDGGAPPDTGALEGDRGSGAGHDLRHHLPAHSGHDVAADPGHDVAADPGHDVAADLGHERAVGGHGGTDPAGLDFGHGLAAHPGGGEQHPAAAGAPEPAFGAGVLPVHGGATVGEGGFPEHGFGQGADLPGHVEVTQLDPAHLDPAHLDPAHLDPAHLDPAHLDPAHFEGAGGDPDPGAGHLPAAADLGDGLHPDADPPQATHPGDGVAPLDHQHGG